jgi:hypothetical protein
MLYVGRSNLRVNKAVEDRDLSKGTLSVSWVSEEIYRQTVERS